MPQTPNQDFNSRNLGWMRRWRSQDHLSTKTGEYPANNAEWNQLLTTISSQIERDEFKFDRLRSLILRKKITLTTKSLEETLVLRKINDNIRRAYGLSQPNRDQLIRTAKQALAETTPKFITRLDISKCFESINRKKLLGKLREDGLVSHQSLALLDQVFAASRSLKPAIDKAGLPRGVIVSTSLSELTLREIDHSIRAIDGVYLLLRYVDDLLVFSTTPNSKIVASAEKVLGAYGLTYNEKKLERVPVECKCERQCTHGQKCPCKDSCKCLENDPNAVATIEFLGYKFVFPKYNMGRKEDKNNSVYCLLSDKKIRKIKSRIHYAIKAFEQTSDIQLLTRRISFLSSNFAVKRNSGQKALLSGLAYTHSQYSE